MAKKRVIEHKIHALNAQAELAAREGNADSMRMVSPTPPSATCVELATVVAGQGCHVFKNILRLLWYFSSEHLKVSSVERGNRLLVLWCNFSAT